MTEPTLYPEFPKILQAHDHKGNGPLSLFYVPQHEGGSIIWSILFYNVSCGTPGFFRGVRNYRKGGGWGMQVDYTLDPYLEAISTFSFITLSNSGRKKLPLL